MNPFEIKIPSDRLRVLQIVGAAIPGGAIVFAIIVSVMHPPVPPFNLDVDIMVLVFLGQLLTITPLAFIVPTFVMRSTVKEAFKNVNLGAEIEQESLKDAPPKQTNKFMEIYTTQMIVGAALLEGIAIFGIVVYLLNQSMICLAGAAVLILILLVRIPTLTKVQNSLANTMREHDIIGERKI